MVGEGEKRNILMGCECEDVYVLKYSHYILNFLFQW